MVMLKNYLILKLLTPGLLLSFCLSTQVNSGLPPEAKLISRFEQHVEYPADYEVLAANAKSPNDRIALRLCSTDSILRAFYAAAVRPDVISLHISSGYLVGWYKTSPERTLILRSTDCLGNDPSVVPVELWALPSGAEPPTSSESMRFCQLEREYLALNHLKGHRPQLIKRREYESALRKLIAKLRANPKSLSLIQGYFLRGQNPKIERNLKDFQSFMERQNIRQSRYVVRLSQFSGDFYPPTPEPDYPDITLVRLAESCTKE
jgi:hypothetical protein